MSQSTELKIVHPHAAGVDIGAESHYAAVPRGRDPEGRDVREFSAFTEGLRQLCEWLKRCGIETVALESTGVYWIALYERLEAEGLKPQLVDARQVRNVSGRKSDVLDCQWLQQLHSFGLLAGAFRPQEQMCVLRSYMRQRERLISDASEKIQHMQKALTQMNLKLQHVVSDISGETGMRIIRAIVEGARDPQKLAKLRDGRCHSSERTIAASLEGSYRAEHLFELKQALELYEFYQKKVKECDKQIEAQLNTFDDQSGGESPPPNGKRVRRSSGNAPDFDLRGNLYRLLGVDLTAMPGMDALSVFKVISEIGTDITKWATAERFASWTTLCPHTRISGNKRLRGRGKRSAHRVAHILRVAAQTLKSSKTSLGAMYRSVRAKAGPASAVRICAHKMARIIYTILKTRKPYRELGEDSYAQQNRERIVRNLTHRAKALGFELSPVSQGC